MNQASKRRYPNELQGGFPIVSTAAGAVTVTTSDKIDHQHQQHLVVVVDNLGEDALLPHNNSNSSGSSGSGSSSNNNSLNKLGCAINALKCSSRAVEDDDYNGAFPSNSNNDINNKSNNNNNVNAADGGSGRHHHRHQQQQQQHQQHPHHAVLPVVVASEVAPKSDYASRSTKDLDRVMASLSCTNFADFDSPQALAATAAAAAVIASASAATTTSSPRRRLERDHNDGTEESKDEVDTQGKCGLNVRTLSIDSNETETTCNHGLERLHWEPKTKIQTYDSGVGDSGNGTTLTDGELYGLPPKQIMRRSLSLGDSLSPTDDKIMSPTSPTQPLEDEPSGTTTATTTTTTTTAITTTQGDNDDVVHRTVDPAIRLPDIHHHDACRNAKGTNHVEVKKVAEETVSNVSSFPLVTPIDSMTPSVPPIRHEPVVVPQPKRKEPRKRQPAKITPHPFFWRSHPNVTMKSYHFQQRQQRPRIRRVVPQLERVPSADSSLVSFNEINASKNDMTTQGFRIGSSLLCAPTPRRFEMGSTISSTTTTVMTQKEHEEEPVEDVFSPYLHPAVVRKMWMETQPVPLPANSTRSSRRTTTPGPASSSVASSATSAASSAREMVESIASYLSRQLSESSSIVERPRPEI